MYLLSFLKNYAALEPATGFSYELGCQKVNEKATLDDKK
jgi:hypothetical protein